VNAVIRGFDHSAGLTMQIVGGFDLFPSWYPETGPLLVGSLDYFFDEAQLQLPYRVWLRTDPDVDYDQLAEGVFQISLGAQGVLASRPRILEAQGRPERQGLFGLLSVGFGAAAVLAALGFLLYALSLFRRRSVELGVLRAIGMSTWQMAVLVACEQGFVLLVGGAVGTGLGVWASRVYIPFLQIGAEATSRVPPFVVEVPWSALLRVYALFGALFVFALAALVRSLWHMKVFQAIKLGETV
jgi:putative ABC transport system permease protein